MEGMQKNISRQDNKVEIYKIFFLPIMMVLGFVPLIMRLKVMDADIATQSILKQEQILDFFSQYKASALMVLAGAMLFILMLIVGWNEIKKSYAMRIYYILLVIYLLFTGISTLRSDYPDIAWWGMADRAEGVVTILCYGVLLFYTTYIVNNSTDYKYIIYPLAFLVIVLGVLGLYQYIGKDLLVQTQWGQRLIVPEQYASVRGNISSMYESGRIYGTLYHYNYMGSFAAMMLPLFLVMTLFFKETRVRILLGCVTIVATFLLLGSTSRGGLIGVGCSLVAFIIIFGKEIVKHYKVVVKIVLCAMILLLGLNMATKGRIFERIPLLIKDMISIVKPVDTSFDYRDALPIRAIQTVDNSIYIEMQNDTLIIEATEYDITFKDGHGNHIDFKKEDINYVTEHPTFIGLTFSNQRVTGDEIRDYVVIGYQGQMLWVVEVNTEVGAYLVDPSTLEPMTIEYPEAIGFKGKEKLGSARGYIWSRTLPMLKDTLIIGYGPDNYPLKFPQGDYFGKWYAYDTPYMIVDKPHNLYLQIATNQGGIALIAFVGIMLLYIGQSIKLYRGKLGYMKQEVIGIACVVAIIGYLGAGVFNDSVISVAPIFWVLLGFGIATNEMVKESRLKNNA